MRGCIVIQRHVSTSLERPWFCQYHCSFTPKVWEGLIECQPDLSFSEQYGTDIFYFKTCSQGAFTKTSGFGNATEIGVDRNCRK